MTAMHQTREVNEKIGGYLEAVRAHLGDTPEDERDEIVANLESHIRDAVKQRAQGEPSQEDVAAVLAEMDPPDRYAQMLSENEVAGARGEAGERKVCSLPILAAVMAALGPILVASSEHPFNLMDGRWEDITAFKTIARIVLLPLGIASPFVSTALGLLAVSRIRAAKGRLIGMPAAIAAGLFYPLALLDYGILYGAQIAGNALGKSPMRGLVWAAGILIVIIADILIIRAVWREAAKPVGETTPI